ncbi:hypothetical protein DSO57_1024128 [Entomophthora muscae]|uniref:Uncharacterized protein n=1 Tax=Entomophthora muscae TaxID=34485 RepID=A0ACC2SRN1_9FUNG|nr:hypothetical protein DSO57_1024128 [Entomophthora muscae]
MIPTTAETKAHNTHVLLDPASIDIQLMYMKIMARKPNIIEAQKLDKCRKLHH